MPDLNQAIAKHMSKEKESTKRKEAIDNEIETAEYILKNLRNKARENNLLPLNSGITSIDVNSQIEAYNTLMIKRK